jgi:small subunit ribosomal protein S17
MAEEEKSEQQEQPEEEPEAQSGDDAPEAEAETPEAEGEAEAEGPGEEGAGEAAAPAEADEEGLDWKARRRLERSRRATEARPARSPGERQGEREQRHRARAVARRRHRQSRRAKKGEPGVGTPRAERRPNPAKVRQGVVVSDRADKTITVRIDTARRHPTYEKIVRRSRTLRAHDEQNEAGAGDVVRVVETRPISRSKRWRLLEVVEKAR